MPEQSKLFDEADYYDTDNTNEILTHTELEEALDYCFDNAWVRGMTAEQLLEEVCPITVYAFHRKKVDPGFAASVVDSWMEHFDEDHWCEEYGNFEDYSNPWKPEDLDALKAELTSVFKKYTDKARVWQCDQVAKAVYTKEEVRVLGADYLEGLADG